jgi:hypothetical protein
MIDYNFQGRLQYIPGGPLNVQMSAWPAVSAGWWLTDGVTQSDCVAAYQSIGAADKATSYVNLNNPGTHNITEFVSGAPDFATATGWYLPGNRRIKSTASVSNKTATYIARIKLTGTSTYRTIIGGSGNGALSLDVEQTTNKFRVLKQGVANIATSTSGLSANTDGVVAVSYDSSGNYAFYLDGSINGSGTNNQTLTSGLTLQIGIQTDVAQPFSGYIMAIALYSLELDATQIAEITANMNAL